MGRLFFFVVPPNQVTFFVVFQLLTIVLSSLFVGVPFVGLFWASGLRKTPKFGTAGLRTLVPIGAAHALGHAGAVLSIGAP